MDLYIYNASGERVGICDSFISLMWIRRYSTAGAFELYTVASDDYAALLMPQRYIYRPDVGESMYISGVQEEIDGDVKKLIVSGYSLDGLFRKRCMKSYTKKSLISTLTAVTSFGLDMEISTDNDVKLISVDIGNDVESNMRDTLTANEYGFRLELDPADGKLVGGIVVGEDLSDTVIFSTYYDNLYASAYAYDEEGGCNRIYGRTNAPTDSSVDTSEGLPTYEYGDTAEGLDCMEGLVYVDPVLGQKYVSDGEGNVTLVTYVMYDNTLEDLIDACMAAYSEPPENISGDVAMDKYRKAFDVGDIVAVADKARGLTLTKRITEVQETYDSTGVSITPTFGEPIKTIYDLIK